MTDQIMEEIFRTRRALPRPNALNVIALHGAAARHWAGELLPLLGYQGSRFPTGVGQFMGLVIVLDPALPVNRVELRGDSRVLARCDVSLQPLTENQEGKK